jgi:hypothetical protein
VVVFVGSAFGDETSVWQRRMSAGESVTILEERQVDTVSGPKAMFKIAPPQREYRWIPGTDVLPVNAADVARHDKNPYKVPSDLVQQRQQTPSPRQQMLSQQQPAVSGPAEGQPSAFSPSRQLARLKQIREEQRQLQELDQKFRSMILADPAGWKLDDIEREYQRLQNAATHQPVAGQIDLRYPAINRYRQRKAELDELNQLTSQTEKRDAELMASQYGVPAAGFQNDTSFAATSIPSMTTFGPASVADTFSIPQSMRGVESYSSEPSAEFLNTLPSLPGLEFNSNSVASFDGVTSQDPAFSTGDGTRSFASSSSSTIPMSVGSSPSVGNPFITGAATRASGVSGSPAPDQSSNPYIGAGILQRQPATDGSSTAAAFVLTSPSGKVLAHVQPENGVNLEPHVGKAVGLLGARYYDESLGSDQIIASGLEPVKIR